MEVWGSWIFAGLCIPNTLVDFLSILAFPHELPTCMNVCQCMNVCHGLPVCICASIRMHTHMYACTHVCMTAYVACMHVCMHDHVCMYSMHVLVWALLKCSLGDDASMHYICLILPQFLSQCHRNTESLWGCSKNTQQPVFHSRGGAEIHLVWFFKAGHCLMKSQ